MDEITGRVWGALRADRLERVIGMGAEVVAPLCKALLAQDDALLAGRAEQALCRLKDSAAVDALCANWAQSRNPSLANILQQTRYLAVHPLDLRVLTALKIGALTNLLSKGSAVVMPLLEALSDQDQEIADNAYTVLTMLTDRQAINVFCEAVMMTADNRLLKIARECRYAPADESRRAFFYCLTEQWENYNSLEQSGRPLLRKGYQAASEPERKRLLNILRQHRKTEICVELLLAKQRLADYEKLDDADWQVVLESLLTGQNWEALWRLVFLAPVEWAAQIVLTLKQADWQPAPWEQDIWLAIRQHCPAQGRQLRLPDGRITAGLQDNFRGAVTTCLAFQPDGNRLAGGGNDGWVRFWNTAHFADNKPVQKEKLQYDVVTSLAFSADGNKLVTAGEECRVNVWQLPQVRWAHTLPGSSGITSCLALSADGQLWGGGRDKEGAFQMWHSPDGHLKFSRGAFHKGFFECFAMRDDGAVLVGGDKEGMVKFWQTRGGEAGLTITAHHGRVRCLALSPSGGILASAGDDGAIRLWHCATGQMVVALPTTDSTVRCLAISHDEQVMAVGYDNSSVALWQIYWGKPLAHCGLSDWEHARGLAERADLSLEIRQGCYFLSLLLAAKFRFAIML
ncbi:MAG TPA: hypothetical protein VGL27_07670 [Negativicutes bacterium]